METNRKEEHREHVERAQIHLQPTCVREFGLNKRQNQAGTGTIVSKMMVHFKSLGRKSKAKYWQKALR